jgi:hypothetical protein
MAIESVSRVLPPASISASRRPPETTPTARESASQENDARRVAESVSGASPATLGTLTPSPVNQPQAVQSGVGTRVTVVPAPQAGDTEGALREVSSRITRASSEAETAGASARVASEAYAAQASARQDLARQQQGEGVRSVDVTA